MKRGLTGQYRFSLVGGEKVKAFIPKPLPPHPHIRMDGTFQRRLEAAQLALGRLDSISLLIPDPYIFLYSYIRREAVLSSQIEGTQSSLSDLMLFELKGEPSVPIDDVVEVSNYVAAMEHGIKRMKEGFPLCKRLLREMHQKLLSRGRGSQASPGEFRHSQNWIGGTRPGNAHFVPPPPGEVEDCMSDLEKFIHDEHTPYPALIKAALIHVQFETIHPFLDGNGRIGRLLISFILHNDKILSEPLLYLSLYFKQHREEYYRLLDSVRNDGDWETWLDFFLYGVEQTARNAVETAKRLHILFTDDAKKVESLGRLTNSALRIFECLRERPFVTYNEIKKRTGLTLPTITKGMSGLMGLGIAKELSGKQRNQIFCYDRYLSILNEEMEM